MKYTIEQEVKLFLKSVDIYALGDLEKMLECADYQSTQQRLAVPIALTCFSVLDIIGFLIRKDIDEKALKDTKGNLHFSLAYFFDNEITQIHRDMIVEIYRNGTMHMFIPKAGFGIHNTFNGDYIITSNGKSFDFNVYNFAKLLIKKLKKEITCTFDCQWETILRNYRYVDNDNIKRRKKYSNQLPRSPKKIVDDITTTRQFP